MAELVQLPLAQGGQVHRTGTKLRAGVVGLGKQALEDHIPGLLGSDAAELVAVCDEDAEVVREQQYKLRVAGYTDADAMFSGEQLDFVVICVPHNAGRHIIEIAAARGIHVLKEAVCHLAR